MTCKSVKGRNIKPASSITQEAQPSGLPILPCQRAQQLEHIWDHVQGWVCSESHNHADVHQPLPLLCTAAQAHRTLHARLAFAQPQQPHNTTVPLAAAAVLVHSRPCTQCIMSQSGRGSNGSMCRRRGTAQWGRGDDSSEGCGCLHCGSSLCVGVGDRNRV